jgi:hypothetical protein
MGRRALPDERDFYVSGLCDSEGRPIFVSLWKKGLVVSKITLPPAPGSNVLPYGAIARGLFPVEPMPPGAPLIYDGPLDTTSSEPDPV